MSLVAYASSDESDQEENQHEDLRNSVPAVKIQNATISTVQASGTAVITREVERTSVTEISNENEVEHFSGKVESEVEIRPVADTEETVLPLIPPPEKNPFVSFDSVTPMPWKGFNNRNNEAKKTVKISVPSLLEFADEEPDKKKPKKEMRVSGKASKLFTMLPEPKHKSLKEHSRPLVPHTVKKSAKVEVSSKQTKKPKLDDEDDEDSGTVQDFFSLNASPPDITGSWTLDAVPETPATNTEVVEPSVDYLELEPPTSSSTSHSVVEDDFGLDSVAIKRLAGRKANLEEVDFIDINEEAMRPDANEWLTKQLTMETQARMHHSHRRSDGPTTQQRRKHQITYLAFQAKEKELELKNQWSQSRMSRKQTQSKYGF